MLVDISLLAQQAKPDVFRRGAMMARLGSVQNLLVRPEKAGDWWIQAQVKDGGTQQVSARVTGEHKISGSQCTCPAHRLGICHHVVALAHAANAWKPVDEETKVKKKEERKRKKVVSDLKQAVGDISVIDGDGLGIRGKHEFLDGVELFIKYEREADRLLIEAVARYGQLKQPLLSPKSVAKQDEEGVWHLPEREWDVEQEAYQFIVGHVPLAGEEKHAFKVIGVELYEFAKQILPELEYRFHVIIDPSAQHVLSIAFEEFVSDWQVRDSTGVDWFDFAVQWHCNQSNLTLNQLEEMLASGRSYVRTEKGGFIECKNREQVEELVELLKRTKQQEDGSFRSRLYLAPELFETVRSIRQSRFEATNQAFDEFLKELKEGKPIEPIQLPESLDKELRSYQKEGVAWMTFLHKHRFGGVLADDMGLGKTAQVLAFLEYMRGKSDRPSLVICPKTLLLIWQMEAAKFTPNLRVLVIDGLAQERLQAIQTISNYDVIITSYSTLQRDIPQYLQSKQEFFACILDEAQYIKNARSQSAEVVKLVPARFRLALTGTPLENGVHELWSIFDFLMPEFLGDARRFANKFERPIREKHDKDAIESLKRKIRPFMLRRVKETLLHDLPPKIEQVSYSNLTPEQVIVYTRTLQEVRKEIFQTVQEKGFQKSKIEILASLTKLRRICDHPHLVDPLLPASEELSGKMALCMELVRQAVEGGHKVLLFSQYTSMLDILREALNAERIKSCTVEGKTRDRQAEIARFCDTDTPVFLLSLRAGGTGLTLTAADMVILFDPWWNPQVERQAMDRAHRLGQTKTVNVYKLVTKNTIEEKVLELQSRKQSLFDALMTENANLGESLNWEDVQGLLK